MHTNTVLLVLHHITASQQKVKHYRHGGTLVRCLLLIVVAPTCCKCVNIQLKSWLLRANPGFLFLYLTLDLWPLSVCPPLSASLLKCDKLADYFSGSSNF